MTERTEICGHKTESAEGEYVGTIAEAVATFREEFQGFTIDYINDQLVLGWCEDCDCPLFDDSNYHESEDGIMWCKSHGDGEEPADG